MSDTRPELSPLKRALVEIRELRARVAAAEGARHEPVAVVGMGLRLPGGADDPSSFWQLLADGVDAISVVPADRWDADALFDPDPDAPGRMVTREGGFLADVDRFDADFFGISPREAETMDPQQRLLLEVAWEALEHAGIPADDLFGAPAGVFVGIGNSDHLRLLLADADAIDTYTSTGNALSIAAGRLAYVLGTRGPALAIDTACSSSLVALHTAVRSLREGECDLALAGGVNLILAPELSMNFSRARMLAADGRCKTFDAGADGYVRSEGCAVVVLKRLADAVAAGDDVLAVVRGSAVNQDGRSGGLTAPNGPAQVEVIAAALADAAAAPDDVVYVEAHGTGTLLGDPIEAGAVAAALCADRDPDHPLLLGSVKTNIGHTETVAGLAGLIKGVLVLQHATVPPHLHLHELNPHIAGPGHALEVPTRTTPLPGPPGRRLVGVSSFGLSGTNAHVVLGEAPSRWAADAPASAGSGRASAVRMLPVSARSDPALTELAGRYADMLESTPALALDDVVVAAATTRSHLPRRLAVDARDRAATIAALRTVARGDDVTGAATWTRTPDGATGGGTAFLYSGHGSLRPGAGSGLYAGEPVFRAAVDRCGRLLSDELDIALTEVLFGEGTLLADMTYAQPALFALQHALTETWAAWGVRPDVVAGHSAGEYAAAVAAGVLSLEDGCRLIAARGRLLASVPGPGRMAALFTDEATVAAALEGREDVVGIAAVNGPTTTVVSGRPDAVEAVVAELGLGEDDLRWLDIGVAAHSPLVEPILDDLAAVVASVPRSRPAIGLVSSMSGRPVDAELTDPGYWREHLRAPVRFADVFRTLHEQGCRTFVEVGVGSTLLGLGRRERPDAQVAWIPSLGAEGDEVGQLGAALGGAYVAGARLDWGAVVPDRPGGGRLVALPTYPWQRASHRAPAVARRATAPPAPLFETVALHARRQAEQGPLDLQADRYPRRWALADRAATAAIVRTIRDLGLFTRDGEAHRRAELVGPGRLAPGYEHLVARWLDHLVEDGLLVRDGDRVVSPRALPEPDLGAALAELVAACADISPFARYVARCCEQLTAVVTGAESALSTLFPGGSYETVDFNYGTWAVARYHNAIVRAAVEGAVAARPSGRLRVLEVGAGTGGTTAAVLPGLPVGRVDYTFTDVSPFFLARAAERFAENPGVTYAELDLEDPPEAQGYAPGSFDVVVAANVLHATRDLDRTLAHVRQLLAPGGVLVAIENTTHPRFLDVTSGLMEGWERFDDSWRDDVPLLDPARWSDALHAGGFTAVAVEPGAGAPTAGLLQHVLLARAPGDEVAAIAAATPSPTSAGTAPPRATGGLDALALLEDALPDERHDVLVRIVRHAVAAVLRVADEAAVGRDRPLLDLGFDSLMAVELRDRLARELDLSRGLPATLLFDRPTVAAIATFLGDQLAAGVEGAPGDGLGADPPPSASASASTSGVGAAALAEMSDDEVAAMLMAKLSGAEGEQ